MKRLNENFHKPHVLIVGAGIIGKFNAIELAELGYEITITDPALDKNSIEELFKIQEKIKDHLG